MDSLTHEEIQAVLDRVLLHTTEAMAHMQIRNKPAPFSDDICTVSAVFEGNCDLSLSLCADRLFFIRLAQGIFEYPDVSEQDVEDVAKEYLNVVCGRLVGQVSSLIHRPTSFRFPVFQPGYHIFHQDAAFLFQSYYINNANDSIMLVLALSLVDKENNYSAKCNLDHINKYQSCKRGNVKCQKKLW